MALWGRLVTPFFVFSAFLILLLVSLSLPIIKSIYLFEVVSQRDQNVETSVGTSFRFGIWGLCVGAYNFSGGRTTYNPSSQCTPAKLGYSFNTALLNLIGHADIVNAVLKGLTVILILHPIATGILLLTFIGALIYALRPTVPHAISICTLLIAIIPAIVTTVVFVIDIIVVIIARIKIQQATDGGLTVRWGNAVWMTCASVALSWAAVIGLSMVACGCFGLGRQGFRDFAKAQFYEKDPRDSTLGPSVPRKPQNGQSL